MDEEDKGDPSDVASDSCGQLSDHLSSDNYTEDERSDQEPPIPPDLEWLEELSEEDDGEVDLVLTANRVKERTNAETARMFKLRRNLDQLDSVHRQKEHDVLKAREELELCRLNLKSLLEQRDYLETEMVQQKAGDNVVFVFRLRAQHKHLCQKLQTEEELEGHVHTNLKQLELELSEVEDELGRLSSLRQEVQEEEQLFRVLKTQKAARRLQHERQASQNLQLKMQNRRDKPQAMTRKEERKIQTEAEEYRARRKIAARFLKETTKRTRQQEVEKEEENRQLLEKRIQAVKSLKYNIEATQETIRVQQSRAKASAERKEQHRRQQRESLHAQDLSSIKNMHQQKQLEKRQQQQKEFEERQKSNKVAILAKILQEEQQLKARKRHQTKLPKLRTTNKLPSLGSTRESILHYLDRSSPSPTEERAKVLRQFSDVSSSSSASTDGEIPEDTTYQGVEHQSLADSLAEPEFSGLWGHDYKNFLEESTSLGQTEVQQEEPAMTRGLLPGPAKTRHGSKSKMSSFISKPEVILFKNFEVGKMYKKKIILTNINYTTNHCKLLGVSAQLKDFITINFEPPGFLSAGMSCGMQAIFHPMINEDLEGEVQFASIVGPFSVPVRCTIKKCEPEVDGQFIDFGSHLVGQTISRTITLTNKGALPTLFSLETSTCLRPETQHVQMPPQVFAHTCQETSDRNTSPGSQKNSVEKENQEPLETTHCEKTGPEAIPDATSAEAQGEENPEDTSDISLVNVREGEIGPFESIKLEIVFTPTVTGEAKLDFHIKFSDPSSEPIPIRVRGIAVSIPVWVVQPSIDLKICMLDHLYQEAIVVQSRASTSLKVTFEVCPEMRKHMEIIPKTGFIQAQSSFNAQLKFLPRCSLSTDAKRFFDSDTGVLEVPVSVQVASQVQPIHFIVQAVVTSSDLQFEPAEVDFGYCSIYQSVKSSVRLTNLSLMPQDFGFMAVPEFFEVQPNDGFGTLLPQETLELDLIFSGNKAKEYTFQLHCKSAMNRDFQLSCRAVGVHPPLELSHSLIQFGATALGDNSTAIIYLNNPHINGNQSKQPITAVGKDAVTPVVPRLFSFTLPEDSYISITPSTGRLLPGERCLLQVMFRPRLFEQDIKEDALRRLHQAKLLREKELPVEIQPKQETKKEIPVERSKGKKTSGNHKNSKMEETKEIKPVKRTVSPNPADVQKGSEMYEEARASLLYSFTKHYKEYTIPCFISDGDPPEEDKQAQPAWSPLNTLYLKLQCPAVQPSLAVISNNGQKIIDFQEVAVGEKAIERLTVQNISMEWLELRTSVLDIHGPFTLLSSLRGIRPGEKYTLVLAFSPTLEKKFCETLTIRDHKMNLDVTLYGNGVIPAVTFSHPGGLLDFGYVLEKESTSQIFQLQNSSAVAVGFRMLQESLSPSRPQGGAENANILLGCYTDTQVQPTVGTQNYSALSVFSVLPMEGSIDPGESLDITVTFHPDHPSVNYSDKLTLELMHKNEVCVMDLKGAASSCCMYLYGGDVLTVPIESLLPPLTTSQTQVTESEEMERPIIPMLVTLLASYSGETISPAVRELQVGCIDSIKKSGEFHFDKLACLQQQGFHVEPTHGTLEAGQKSTIRITWTPQSGYKPYEVVQACVHLTLRGNLRNVYNVTLMALVSNSAD